MRLNVSTVKSTTTLSYLKVIVSDASRNSLIYAHVDVVCSATVPLLYPTDTRTIQDSTNEELERLTTSLTSNMPGSHRGPPPPPPPTHNISRDEFVAW